MSGTKKRKQKLLSTLAFQSLQFVNVFSYICDRNQCLSTVHPMIQTILTWFSISEIRIFKNYSRISKHSSIIYSVSVFSSISIKCLFAVIIDTKVPLC